MDFEAKFETRDPSAPPSHDALESALRPFLRDRRIVELRALDGGYRNLNFKFIAEGIPTPFVLRLSKKARTEIEAELSVLKWVNRDAPVPTALHIDLDNKATGQHIIVFEYIEGTPLMKADKSWTRAEVESFASELGTFLAAVHKKRLPKPGLLGPELSIAVPLEPFDRAVVDHMLQCLDHAHKKSRFTAEETKEIREFITANASVLSGITPDRALVHSDFNQKNILATPDKKVAAVLDWEFAFSGAPIMDFANFFRFESELKPGYETALIGAYRNAGGILPDDWKRAAKFIDLINMLMFLSGTEDRPKTFATSRQIIRSTIQAFRT